MHQAPPIPRQTTPDRASSGIPALDAALGGLFWGDNVVWEVEESGSVDPFFRAIAVRASADYDYAAYVTVTRAPDDVRAQHPELDVIDARPGTPLGQPGPLLGEVRKRCSNDRRDLLVFDPLEAIVVVRRAARRLINASASTAARGQSPAR